MTSSDTAPAVTAQSLSTQARGHTPSPPLDERSKLLRRLVIRALEGGQRGHPGPALSLIEILRVLYDDILNVRPDRPTWPDRDRLILSKGHGCLALYAVLADRGFFPLDELDRFCHLESFLGGHPERGSIPGVEASTGALGHGLSIGVGMALAARLQRAVHRTFVIMGDGEINEGAVWEAAMTAAQHKLTHLTALIDYNKMQSYSTTREVLDLEPLADKWQSFGWSVREVDGHDPTALRAALRALPWQDDRPGVLICHTVKGKGIPDAEHNATWHHRARLSREELDGLYKGLS